MANEEFRKVEIAKSTMVSTDEIDCDKGGRSAGASLLSRARGLFLEKNLEDWAK